MRVRTGALSHKTFREGTNEQKLVGGGWEVGWKAEGIEANEGWRGLREWLCRLLVLWSCCCSVGCVSFRHSPASPRHEPRRKGVLLHAQLLCKSVICDVSKALPSLPRLPVSTPPWGFFWRGGVIDTWVLQFFNRNKLI